MSRMESCLGVGSRGEKEGRLAPPLCWRTLSLAPFAPPPLTYDVPLVCLNVAASSHTSTHQMLLSVHVPRQCTPSPLLGPMMALERVAPSSRMKTASLSPPSVCPWHVLLLRSHCFMPPSKVALAAIVFAAASAEVPELWGKVVWSAVLVAARATLSLWGWAAARPATVARKRAGECMAKYQCLNIKALSEYRVVGLI